MRKSVPVALVLVAVIIATWVMPAQALTNDETIEYINRLDYVNNAIRQLQNNGKESNDEIYSVYINLTNSSQGTVTSTVYKTVYETTTIQTHSVLAQPIEGEGGTKDKLSRFFLYIANDNRYNMESPIVMGLKGATPQEIVAGYVYGERKSEILNTYIAGIADCLGSPALWTNGSSGSSGSNNPATLTKTEETTTKNPDSWAEKYLTTAFTVDATTYTVMNTNKPALNDTATEVRTMDVSPYIKNNRTYVPVRYLAYSLGVPENGVTWNSKTQSVGITKENTHVGLTISNDIMTINGKSKFMDVAPEIASGRTMLPARWVAEALGAEVAWDDKTKQAVIKMSIEKPGN